MESPARDVQLTELRDMIKELNKTVSAQSKTMESMTAMLAEKDQRIAELTEELRLLRRKMFGASKERTVIQADSDQLDLFAELGMVPEQEPELVEAEFIEVKAHKKAKKTKATFDELFGALRVEKVYVDTLSDEEKTCSVCGSEMRPIGTERIRRDVVHVKPEMYVIEYMATTYECPRCKDTEDPQFIKDEGAPPALLDHSYVSASLAAWSFYQKFALAVPYYRLEKSFEELGGPINRTTMANWTVQCNERYFKPMTDLFLRKAIERRFLMMDETPIQVLKEPGKAPESKSYVWLLRTGEDGLPPIVYYRYSPTRSGDTAVEMLQGIRAGTYLMCDGFSGYNKLKDVRRCTCYAHIRRYFYEAIPKGHGNDITNPAVQGVMYCNKLFEYERKYAERGYKPETRKKRRLKDEKPVIEAFIAWADKQSVSGNGKFAKAVTYLQGRRNYLMTYLEDCRCSISNNWSENSVRPVTVGRKNWLFSSSIDGANASMGIYTIVEMAKLYGLSRYKYLEYLLRQRPDSDMTDEELERFAPWNEEVQKICSKG
ncbi:MAG: IS66 family transposase [Firmicutes bacterium]|nr:IS66 family transposase [Bacillota bacterium]